MAIILGSTCAVLLIVICIMGYKQAVKDEVITGLRYLLLEWEQGNRRLPQVPPTDTALANISLENDRLKSEVFTLKYKLSDAEAEVASYKPRGKSSPGTDVIVVPKIADLGYVDAMKIILSRGHWGAASGVELKGTTTLFLPWAYGGVGEYLRFSVTLTKTGEMIFEYGNMELDDSETEATWGTYLRFTHPVLGQLELVDLRNDNHDLRLNVADGDDSYLNEGDISDQPRDVQIVLRKALLCLAYFFLYQENKAKEAKEPTASPNASLPSTPELTPVSASNVITDATNTAIVTPVGYLVDDQSISLVTPTSITES